MQDRGTSPAACGVVPDTAAAQRTLSCFSLPASLSRAVGEWRSTAVELAPPACRQQPWLCVLPA